MIVMTNTECGILQQLHNPYTICLCHSKEAIIYLSLDVSTRRCNVFECVMKLFQST
jgi:hypothetical protein